MTSTTDAAEADRTAADASEALWPSPIDVMRRRALRHWTN